MKTEVEEGLRLAFPFVKRDSEKREVWGFATTEDVDSQGEIVDFDASVKAFETWTERFNRATQGESLGNIREMHGEKAVGKLIAWHPDYERRGIWVGAKISESQDGQDTWLKIADHTLNGFSIGAPKAEREFRKVPGEMAPISRVINYDMAELSIVDNPSCPGSFIQEVKLAKSASGQPVLANQDVLKPFDNEPSMPVIEKSDTSEAPVIKANAFIDKDGQVWKMAGSTVEKGTRQDWVQQKIQILINEGKAPDQAKAIAHSMASEHFGGKAASAALQEESMNQAQLEKQAAELQKTAELEKGKKIGPQHKPTGTQPGVQVPKTQALKPMETPPKPAKMAADAPVTEGKPGGPHVDATEEVPGKPKGQGDQGEAAKNAAAVHEDDLPNKPKEEPMEETAESEAMPPPPQPGSTPMASPAARPSSPATPHHPDPGSVAPMGKPDYRYGYCAFCGDKFAEANMPAGHMGEPYHKECADDEDRMHTEDEMKRAGATSAGMHKVFSAAIDPLVKSVNQGFASMGARIEALEQSPQPGGPARTELPPQLRPVSKGGAVGAPESSEEDVLEKAIGVVEDPFLRDKLQRQLAKSMIARQHKAREGR